MTYRELNVFFIDMFVFFSEKLTAEDTEAANQS